MRPAPQGSDRTTVFRNAKGVRNGLTSSVLTNSEMGRGTGISRKRHKASERTTLPYEAEHQCCSASFLSWDGMSMKKF
jgi:hypothetical protein